MATLVSYRAEGALSIVSQKNIVENESVLKEKKRQKMKQQLTPDLINQKKIGRHIFFMTLLISAGGSLLCILSGNRGRQAP